MQGGRQTTAVCINAGACFEHNLLKFTVVLNPRHFSPLQSLLASRPQARFFDCDRPTLGARTGDFSRSRASRNSRSAFPLLIVPFSMASRKLLSRASWCASHHSASSDSVVNFGTTSFIILRAAGGTAYARDDFFGGLDSLPSSASRFTIPRPIVPFLIASRKFDARTRLFAYHQSASSRSVANLGTTSLFICAPSFSNIALEPGG